MLDYIWSKNVFQGFVGNFYFWVCLGFLGSALFNRRKVYKLLGLNKHKKITIYFSNTKVKNAIDTDGNHNVYSGNAIPQNEALEIPGLATLLGIDHGFLLRFFKFWTFQKIIFSFELSPENKIQAEADKLSNLISIGGPGYNWMTRYFLDANKTKLKFKFSPVDIKIVDSSNNELAIASSDYDYGILEKFYDNSRSVVIAAGFHINGTRGALYYLINPWRELPTGEFALLIKFPNPSKDGEGYKKPLEVRIL